jgi:hypothetical protein
MSKMSEWLQRQGFDKDPFAEFPTQTSLEDLFQRTSVFDQSLADLMLDDPQPLVFFEDGNKMLSRLYASYRRSKIKRSVVLTIHYTNFETVRYQHQGSESKRRFAENQLNRKVPLQDHTAALFSTIAESAWNHFVDELQTLNGLDIHQTCAWWRAFFSQYLPGVPFMYRTDNDVVNALTVSNFPEFPPFNPIDGFIKKLKTISAQLVQLGVKKIVIFVDGSDEEILRPLLETPQLFSTGILWRFFLLPTMQEWLEKSEFMRNGRLQLYDIQWQPEQLKQLLSGRLDLASKGEIIALHEFCSEELFFNLKPLKIDEAFIELVMQKQEAEPINALLKLGQSLFLIAQEEGEELYFTENVWDRFLNQEFPEMQKEKKRRFRDFLAYQVERNSLVDLKNQLGLDVIEDESKPRFAYDLIEAAEKVGKYNELRRRSELLRGLTEQMKPKVRYVLVWHLDKELLDSLKDELNLDVHTHKNKVTFADMLITAAEEAGTFIDLYKKVLVLHPDLMN